MKTISKLIFTAVLSFSALSFQAKAEDFPEAIKPLMQKYTCFACHKVDTKKNSSNTHQIPRPKIWFNFSRSVACCSL